MSSLGSLVVSLSANTAQFTSDLGKAAHLAAQRMDGMKKNAQMAGKAIGAMFLAGVGAAAVMVKQSIDNADQMGKLAQKAGMSVEAFSALVYAGKLADVEASALQASMSKLAKTLSEVAVGGGEDAAAAFKVLGISVKDADGKLKNSDVILEEVAGQLSQYEDGAGKTALAIKIFGKAGAELIPLLNAGADGIREMREEAKALGAVIDDPMKAAAEQFNDNLTRLNAVKQGLVNQITKAVLPSLQNLTDSLVASAKASGGLTAAAEAGATGLKLIMTAVVGVAGVFQTLGQLIGGVASSLVQFFSGNFVQAFDTAALATNDFFDNVQATAKRVTGIWQTEGVKIKEHARNAAKPPPPSSDALKKAEEHAKKIRKMLDDLQEKYDGLGKTEKEKELLKFSREGAGEADKKKAAAILDLTAAKKNLIEVEKMLTDFDHDAGKKLAEQRLELELMGLSTIEQLKLAEARRIDFDMQEKLYDLKKKRTEEGSTLTQDEIAQFTAKAEAAKRASLAIIEIKYEKERDPWFQMGESLRKYYEDAQNLGKQWGDATTSVMKSMEDSLVSFVTTGKMNWKSLANTIIAEIARIQIRAMLSGVFGNGSSGLLGSLFSMFAGGSAFSPTSGSFASAAGGFSAGGSFYGLMPLAGARAGGGPVSGGSSYLVGERGPEIFTPTASGAITPNHAIGAASQPIVINQTLNVDARSDRADIERSMVKMKNAAVAEVANLRQRGDRRFA